jgi:biopolymer transport protein ExbD
MASKLQTEHDVAPNLIPMVDIMFLLLLFFMLGADMGQRDLEDVRLPLAQSIKEDKDELGQEAVEHRLTVNVFHLYKKEVACALYNAEPEPQVCREEKHWRVNMSGRDYTNQEDNLLKRLRIAAGTEGGGPDKVKISEKKLMVRADALAPYKLVQRVLNVAAKAGLYKIECGAARPPT